MKRRPLAIVVALILMVSVGAPSAFLVAPPRAHAGWPVSIIADASVTHLLDLAKNTITSVATVGTQISNYALWIDKYVLEPLAFIESGNLMKAITAGVLKFVAGQTNGTGTPQFVQDLRGFQRNVSDVQALAFITQFGSNSNSPFAGSIASSLRNQYLQETSLRGFFASNQCTLTGASSDIHGFLVGNWSQGGASAWFALTTQNQNNPYLMHAKAQAELGGLIVDSTSAKLNELAWGKGFLSWCGPIDSGGTAASTQPRADGIDQVAITAAVSSNVASAAGDTCTDPKTGKPGVIQTPGSVIADQLNRALGAPLQKVIAFGNQVGPEVNSIMQSVGTVLNTINFATQLLGGASGGGLAGINTANSPSRTALENYQSGDGFLGATQTSVTSSAAGQAVTDMNSRIKDYTTAWNTLSSAAQTASANLTQLAASCVTQSSAAQTASQTLVAPVLTKAQQASTTIASATAMVAKLQAETASTDAGSQGALTADLQTLNAMPPTTTDVVNAQQDALVLNSATSTPSGSLNVSGSTLVDQLNLLAANANALKSSCGVIGP